MLVGARQELAERIIPDKGHIISYYSVIYMALVGLRPVGRWARLCFTHRRLIAMCRPTKVGRQVMDAARAVSPG